MLFLLPDFESSSSRGRFVRYLETLTFDLSMPIPLQMSAIHSCGQELVLARKR